MSSVHHHEDHLFFQQSWQHLMGALDAVLEDARANTAALTQSQQTVDALVSKAERERAGAEAALHALAARRQEMAVTLDELQRELAVAGLPLRGEIS